MSDINVERFLQSLWKAGMDIHTLFKVGSVENLSYTCSSLVDEHYKLTF